jgi:aryl-alcohol dehydrogenase-like predicted oxidoreductase
MMKKKTNSNSYGRREFLKFVASAAFSAPVLITSTTPKVTASTATRQAIHRNERPTMSYHKLGRTGFYSSRLVFGCGAALMGGGAPRLLQRAFEAGINHFDVGSDIYYKGSERNLAPFLKDHRDRVWVVSKAPAVVYSQSGNAITVEQAKMAADYWTRLMDASLKDLQTDYVNAYYLMAVDNPSLVRSEEIHNAFLKAKAAGKVGFFGLSTHKNAQQVLEAAIETGWYDLAMIGITPAGWYDWDTKSLAKGTSTLLELQGLLKQASEAGIGLIGMKTVRFLAPFWSLGKGDPTAFDDVYSEKFISSPLNPFQRAYAYVLQNGLDVVNADMHNFKHLDENIVAAATADRYIT